MNIQSILLAIVSFLIIVDGFITYFTYRSTEKDLDRGRRAMESLELIVHDLQMDSRSKEMKERSYGNTSKIVLGRIEKAEVKIKDQRSEITNIYALLKKKEVSNKTKKVPAILLHDNKGLKKEKQSDSKTKT